MTTRAATPTRSSRTFAVTLALTLVLSVVLLPVAYGVWLDVRAETAAVATEAEVMRIIGAFPNQGHANAKHAEAPEIRATMRDNRCRSYMVMHSPHLGTVLGLCQLSDGQWGGRIIRAYSNGRPLNGRSYEASTFAAPWSYWQRVIERDGYVPAPASVINYVKQLGGV